MGFGAKKHIYSNKWCSAYKNILSIKWCSAKANSNRRARGRKMEAIIKKHEWMEKAVLRALPNIGTHKNESYLFCKSRQ
jgi:hypothetical protein